MPAFFHDLLISRCRDAVRGEHHQHSAMTYDYDAQGNAVPRRVVQQWDHIFLDATRDHTESPGGAYEDEIASDVPDGECLAFEADALCACIEALAWVAEQLAYQRAARLAESVTCLILAIKWEVNQTAPPNARLSLTITQLNPCPRRLITLLDALVR